MTSAGGSADGEQPGPIDLTKGAAEPFDPYRFGKPDVPPPPEYAPPGYVPDPPATPAPPSYPGSTYPGPAYPGSPNPSAPSVPGGGYPPMPPTGYGAPPYGGYPPHQNQYPAQQPYGMPPPYGPYSGAQQGNGKAVAGMVLGIVSILLCWANFFALVVIVPGLIFSLLGLSDSKSRGGRGRSQAIAGLICVSIAIVLGVIFTILEFRVVRSCSGIEHGTDAYKRCVRDKI